MALEGVITSYNDFLTGLSEPMKIILNLLVFTLLIVIYSIVIWKLYRFIAKKNIIKLDLRRYDAYPHPGLAKFFVILYYFLVYIILLPILVILWYSLFSFFLLLLSDVEVNKILIVSAAVVASIRMTSYYSEDLSRDLAKMFPFTILVIFLISPNFFVFEKFITQLAQIGSLFSHIFYYLLFIGGLEIILRIFEIIFMFIRGEEVEE